MSSCICTACWNPNCRLPIEHAELPLSVSKPPYQQWPGRDQSGDKPANMCENREAVQAPARGDANHKLYSNPCRGQPGNPHNMPGKWPDGFYLVTRKQKRIGSQYCGYSAACPDHRDYGLSVKQKLGQRRRISPYHIEEAHELCTQSLLDK